MPISRSDLSYLRDVVNGDIALDQENPLLVQATVQVLRVCWCSILWRSDEDYELFVDNLALDIGFTY